MICGTTTPWRPSMLPRPRLAGFIDSRSRSSLFLLIPLDVHWPLRMTWLIKRSTSLRTVSDLDDFACFSPLKKIKFLCFISDEGRWTKQPKVTLARTYRVHRRCLDDDAWARAERTCSGESVGGQAHLEYRSDANCCNLASTIVITTCFCASRNPLQRSHFVRNGRQPPEPKVVGSNPAGRIGAGRTG